MGGMIPPNPPPPAPVAAPANPEMSLQNCWTAFWWGGVMLAWLLDKVWCGDRGRGVVFFSF